MSATQKCGLIRFLYTALLICVTTIIILCLVLTKNPSSIHATVNFKEVQLEMSCEFYDDENGDEK